jgi:putative nucleotidyltransferase with HDIG domain
MNEAIRFLTAMAQALATMSLYAPGHPARARAAETSFQQLRALLDGEQRASFTFVDGDVIFGQQALRSLTGWEWAARLAGVGLQRLEVEQGATEEEWRTFLDQALQRMAARATGALDMVAGEGGTTGAVRFGAVGLRGPRTSEEPRHDDRLEERFDELAALQALDLDAEADAVLWIHGEVSNRDRIPLVEAEAVVSSLSSAMHGGTTPMLPLLRLKEFDQYTTTHALNVSVLAMGLAEFIGLSPREVRAYGVAGMLHDLGKVKVPKEILTKPGNLSPPEWAIMRSHTVEGARIILGSDQALELAALVAFEHHIMINGGGYPERHFRCDCHKASTLVHVCDVYDALRTRRPYRDAWEPARVLEYITQGIGTEFDADVAKAFITMMEKWEPRLAAARQIDEAA